MTRKHHYIPQFHLAGFTPSGTKDDFLFVLDKEKIEQRHQRVPEVAHQRDYYGVEGDLVDRNYLETFFAQKVEDPAGYAFKYLIKYEQMPTGEEYMALMAYLAVLASRVPTVIDHAARQEAEMLKMLLKASVSTPERWATMVERMREQGKDIGTTTYEEMRQFVNSDECIIEIKQNAKLRQLIDTSQILAPVLADRTWSIGLAAGNDFICSDSPLSLVWKVKMPPIFSPGFAMPDTLVTVPITRDLVLLGSFEGDSTKRELDRRMVAGVNSRTAMRASRFIYSTNPDFPWLRNDLSICNLEELKAALRHEQSGAQGTAPD